MIDTKYVRGADKLKARLDTIRRKLNLPDMTQEVGGLLLARTLRRFDREVDPNEVPWKPLADLTQRRKNREGVGANRILVRTGSLRSSIKQIRGGFGSMYTNTGVGVRIGISDPEVAKYAQVHNRGLGRFPMRRFLGVGALDVKAVDSLLRRRARLAGLDSKGSTSL